MKALSVSAGDYLRAIYELGREKSPVSTARIAEVMQVSKASVSDMLRKLNQRNYVDHRPYKGVTLSDSGRDAAEQLLRKYQLWEQYLSRMLPCDADSAAHHAHQLEHATDDSLEQLLADALAAGSIASAPPPDAVPTETPEETEASVGPSLAKVDADRLCAIVACDAADNGQIEFLHEHQMEAGRRLKVLTVMDDGARQVHVAGQDVMVDNDLCNRITVQVLL